MPRTLRFFISYAREDSKIAEALRASLSKSLPFPLSYVDLDEKTFEVGAEFTSIIQDKLDKAHILLVLYTGRLKHSHGFTGQEYGYFLSSKRVNPVIDKIDRKVVPIYLDEPPRCGLH
jgi:TIR domain-containing protein